MSNHHNHYQKRMHQLILTETKLYLSTHLGATNKEAAKALEVHHPKTVSRYRTLLRNEWIDKPDKT